MNSFPLLTGSVHENGIAQINDYDDRYDELGSEYNEVNNDFVAKPPRSPQLQNNAGVLRSILLSKINENVANMDNIIDPTYQVMKVHIILNDYSDVYTK